MTIKKFIFHVTSPWVIPEADPGFPGGDANPKGAPIYYLANWPIFPEHCMKIKKIGPGEGDARPKFYYEDTPLHRLYSIT